MSSPRLARAEQLQNGGPPTIGALGASVVMDSVQNLLGQDGQLENTSATGPPTLSALANLEAAPLNELPTLGSVRSLSDQAGKLASSAVDLRPLHIGTVPQLHQRHPPLPSKQQPQHQPRLPKSPPRVLPQEQQSIAPQDERWQAEHKMHMLRSLQPPSDTASGGACPIGHSPPVLVSADSPSLKDLPTTPSHGSQQSRPTPVQTAPGRPTSSDSSQPALPVRTSADVVVPLQPVSTAPPSSTPAAATTAWTHMSTSQSTASATHQPATKSGQKRQASTSPRPERLAAKRGPGRPRGSGVKLRPPDKNLVASVRAIMKEMKISQQVVSNEAHVSQAVISQWLGSKYTGDNGKVDTIMRIWLQMRNGGGSHAMPGLYLRRSRSASKRRKKTDNGDSTLANAGASNKIISRVRSGPTSDAQTIDAPSSAETFETPRAAENRFNDMLEKLTAFKMKHGHCRVPRIYKADNALGRWVNNIRSGNTNTEKHGRDSHYRGASQEYSTAIGHARLNELGFCWHAKNSYKHAERSRLYDMNDTERLLHPDTIKEIARAMGKFPSDEKLNADLQKGVEAHAGSTALPFSHSNKKGVWALLYASNCASVEWLIA